MSPLPLTKHVQIFESARSVHLERSKSPNAPLLVYRSNYYDFDSSSADGSNSRNLSLASSVAYLIKHRPEFVEVNEPMQIGSWPYIFSHLIVIRALDVVYGKKTIVSSYAINNSPIELALHDKTKLPRFLCKLLTNLGTRALLRMTDRIAFGTPGALQLYESVAPMLHTLCHAKSFPALDCKCPHCSFSEKSDVLVFLGSLEHRKGIRQVMDAWPLISEQAPHLKLHILGKGPLKEEVRAWASRHTGVEFIEDPPRKDIHSVLAGAKALVLLSQPSQRWREQIGLPILEGLSHGCEIITTDQTGIADWLSENGHEVIASSSAPEHVSESVIRAMNKARSAKDIASALPLADSRLEASAWLHDNTGHARP